MESINASKVEEEPKGEEWTDAKKQFTAVMEAGMRGQGLKLSVYMCVHMCRGGGDS